MFIGTSTSEIRSGAFVATALHTVAAPRGFASIKLAKPSQIVYEGVVGYLL